MEAERGASEFEFEAGGRKISGYRSLPASAGGRGVLVIHASAGQSSFIQETCDRLAREGFVALAPDLAPPEAGEGRERRALELDAAVRELLSCDATEGSRVGALGMAGGAELGMQLAATNRRIGALALCAGGDSGASITTAPIAVPVLGIFAGRAVPAPVEGRRALADELTAAAQSAKVVTHTNAMPGFMDDSRPDVYDAAAAAQTWRALLTFLRAEL